MKTESLSDWKYFLRDLDKCTSGAFHDGSFVFRGQRDASWRLITSFDRFFTDSLKNRNSKFDDMMEDFSQKAGNLLNAEYDEVQKVAIAQHYGLPTRVLDWSTSPYIALYFAISDAVVNNQTEPAAIWILEKLVVEKNIDKAELVFLDYLENSDVRIKNQRGMFSKLKLDEEFLDKFLDDRGMGNHLIKLVIPPTCFRNLAKHLQSMDINHYRLFPGIEGVCRQIMFENAL